jgi:hypothetical protein
VALVASLAVCFTLAVPAMAAADVQVAYEILYAVSPKIAQELKPVRMSCEDDGIKMEVISAYINGDKAEIYISMQKQWILPDLFCKQSLRHQLDAPVFPGEDDRIYFRHQQGSLHIPEIPTSKRPV